MGDATEGVRLQGVSGGRVIPAAVPMIHQPQLAVKPLRGEELLGEGDRQGAGEDLPVGVVLHAAHRLRGGVADGHGAAQVVAVDVVEGAVHAGSEALAVGTKTALLAQGSAVLLSSELLPSHLSFFDLSIPRLLEKPPLVEVVGHIGSRKKGHEDK